MPPPYILKRLKPEILANNWSCLLTCTVSGSKGIFRFVLVVKWLDKDTTERIGGFMLYSTPEEEENLGPFETSLRQQHVRLV
ncbi:hypothetical protein CC86DRAFT_368986 [Ophiobolus disseminans]|uniref:Uncharacterized protein n=1 Tax=Ophiobolus disseminans TaxID=1469910 RepID=A0A6A7A6R0_9PLEO|nr:hypothetical protein CC86DRAFT_368986 [Ophiobolus disseminans]